MELLKNTSNLSNIQKEEYLKLIAKFKNENIKIVELSLEENLLNQIDVVYKIISFSEAASNDSNLTGIAFGKQVNGKNWDEIMFNTRSKYFGDMVQRRFALGAFYTLQENQNQIFIKAQKVRRLIVDMFNKNL